MQGLDDIHGREARQLQTVRHRPCVFPSRRDPVAQFFEAHRGESRPSTASYPQSTPGLRREDGAFSSADETVYCARSASQCGSRPRIAGLRFSLLSVGRSQEFMQLQQRIMQTTHALRHTISFPTAEKATCAMHLHALWPILTLPIMRIGTCGRRLH